MKSLSLNEAVEWRTPIWAPAVSSALERASAILPSNARILEIGYNNGMMSSYMAARYGWNIVGYEIDDSLQLKAETTARKYGMEEKIDFRVCSPEDTLLIKGNYDAVFLKSVLYHISDKAVYRKWIDWLHSVVKDGGLVIAVENGRGGIIDRLYRKIIKRSRWGSFLLFDRWTDQELRKRFGHVDISYFGRFSQFFTSYPKICRIVRRFENRFLPSGSTHCFIASIIACK